VQKLSYLHAQLCGDAACVIAGFQLMNDNYKHSIALLKEQFKQTYKQFDAHIHALIDSASPSNSHSSLCEFYNTTEGHIRSIAILGKSEALYGILGKLPPKMEQNIIRAHGRKEWTIRELQVAILNELYILDMGSPVEPRTSSVPPTASFHASSKKPATSDKSKP